MDASSVDAEPDAGVIMFACGDVTCNASETYCKKTPPSSASCEPLGACDSCPCLISIEPCGAGELSITCRSSDGTITLECPSS